jgi:amidase
VKYLDDGHVVYAMSRDNQPALTVAPGETVRVKTKDCYANQLRSPADRREKVDWTRINPATGPIAVTGAAPGDTLAIDILAIRVAEQGVMTASPGESGISRLFSETRTKIIPLATGKARFSDRLALPLAPMIGVIGTAPAGKAVPTGTPGPHGGNMDCKEITAGTRLYLPVAVPGALLALGDLHARMGDGEVVGVGIETAGEVDLAIDLLPGQTVEMPLLDNGKAWMVVASARTLDEAAATAADYLTRLLTKPGRLSREEAGMLLSIAGDLRICQIVDPLMTVRFEIPKEILAQYDISLIG